MQENNIFYNTLVYNITTEIVQNKNIDTNNNLFNMLLIMFAIGIIITITLIIVFIKKHSKRKRKVSVK